MIVSDTKRFVFIHNPKCAGTSVRMSLMPFETTANFFWMFDNWNGKTIDKAHLPIYILRGKYPSYFELLRAYFVFGFVRDPYARAVSAFNELNGPLFEAARGDAQADARYRAALNECIMGLNNQRVMGWDQNYRHFVRQRDMLYLADKCVADVVMKVEEWPRCLDRLEVFMPLLAATIRHARRLNTRALAKPVLEYLTEDSIRTINTLYKDDFALFGYEMIG